MATFSSQIEARITEAPTWTFQTLLLWASSSLDHAYKSGDLEDDGFAVMKAEMEQRALSGKEGLWGWCRDVMISDLYEN